MDEIIYHKEYPELHQFMYNLHLAGMKVDDVLLKGCEFALQLLVKRYGNTNMPTGVFSNDADRMQEAAKMLHSVSVHMGISLEHQREAYERLKWRER